MERKRLLSDEAEASPSKRPKIEAPAQKDDIMARARAIAARISKVGVSTPSDATPTGSGGASTPSNANLPPKPVTSSANGASGPGTGVTSALPDRDEIARRVEEARRRVANATTQAVLNANPYIPAVAPGKKKTMAAPDLTVSQGTGLKVKAHPLLLDTPVSGGGSSGGGGGNQSKNSKKDKYKPMAPKFASTRANARLTTTSGSGGSGLISEPVKANPYTTATRGASTPSASTGGFEGVPKERVGRKLTFNTKGKYIAQGNQMRNQAQIEALKQKVAASAQKAGLESNFDAVERSFRREPPPDAEWWDRSLLPNKTYADVESGIGNLNIRNADSVITIYIQHPIPLPPPGEKLGKPEPKPLKLTTKEQKKLRKQRRAAEMQDHTERVRLGLIPPDPPKVRLANMVRVLTNEAVADPTKLEAKIRREVQARRTEHEKANLERKLTAEQRAEKLEAKKLEDERKGLYAALFRIKKLSDPSHQFKVSKTAMQLGLTGLCVINPNLSVVYVEGGMKGMKHYTRLLEHRVDWTRSARKRDEEGNIEEDGDDEEGDVKMETGAKTADADGEEVSLEDNRCDVLWQGLIAEHAFHSFKTVRAPTDNLAREQLGSKLASFWDTAKNWKAPDDLY